MSDYWATWICGFCAGGGLVFVLSTILTNWEHREWMRITEKHWQFIEQLIRERTNEAETS